MTIATDLNQRERRRYADQLGQLAKRATDLAAALLAEDDETALVHVIVLGLQGAVVTELVRVFKDASDVAKARRELGEDPPPRRSGARDA